MAIWRGTGGPGDATTDAASEASAAANSATSAAASASAAASSANQAEVALDQFTDLYLGERGSDPTVDLDGNPLQTGALYFSTSAQGIKVYNGSIWLNAYDTSVLLPNNNLSDLDNAATARTNLGVEIGTDVQAYDAQLTDIAGLTPTDSNFIVGDGTNFVLESGNTARTSLGRGTGDSPTFTNISVSGTVDGRDVAADGTKLDGIESGATADQTAGEIKTAYESNADTNAFTDAEQTKLSGIETGADVTDVDNVTAAGALMDSEVTNLAEVKAFSSADYATAAQGALADTALQSFTETNDLTAAVTWANVPDANITQSSVTQHQAALSVTESQISDLGTYVVETSATGSAEIPSGTTAQRDVTPAAGYLRFNTTDSSFEGYDGSAWGAIGGGGGATGGGGDQVFYENGQTITTSYTLTTNTNAMSTGPLTVNSGVSVTVPSGSRWVVL